MGYSATNKGTAQSPDSDIKWATRINVSNNSNGIVYGNLNGPNASEGGVSSPTWSYIRLTLSNFNNTSPRIAQIFTVNYDSTGMHHTFLGLGGGTVYGGVDVKGDLTSNGNALLKSGSQTATSTVDGGTNVYTFTDTKGATSTFTVKNGSKGSTGAHVSSVTADKTPAAGNTVTYTMKNTDGTTAGTFKVVNGTNGANGSNGTPAGFGTISASVDNGVGTPSVTVTTSGSNASKNFDFAFKNLKGSKGDKGDTGSVASIVNSGSGNIVTDVSLNTSTKVLTVTKNKTLATVATSGSYGDLINKPTKADITRLLGFWTLNDSPTWGTITTNNNYNIVWGAENNLNGVIVFGVAKDNGRTSF